MSAHPDQHDALQPLIESHLDGSLDDAGFVALQDLLRADADARRCFLRIMNLHSQLHARSATDAAVVPPVADTPEPIESAQRSDAFRMAPVAWSLAAALLVAAAVVAIYTFVIDPASPPTDVPRIATLVDATGAVTINNSLASRGDDYAAGAYSIETGSAEFLLVNRVAVTLTGPTTLHVHGRLSSTLSRGTAAFNCPPGIVGYTVNLPDGSRVVDLGTRFRISLEPDQPTIVIVDEGVVTVQEDVDAEPTTLAAGDVAYRLPDRWVVARPGPESFRAAYRVPAGTEGTQVFGGVVGMDFDVTEPIVLTHLGAFDSGTDGLKRPITVTLYDRDTRAVLARATLSGDDGELVGSTRYVALEDAIILRPGVAGTIAASGYGEGEPLGNQDPKGAAKAPWSAMTDSGALRFVGLGRWADDPDAFPATLDGGPVDRYAAGSFRFLDMGQPSDPGDEPATESKKNTSQALGRQP